MMLSHMASYCHYTSPFRVIWPHFKPGSLIFVQWNIFNLHIHRSIAEKCQSNGSRHGLVGWVPAGKPGSPRKLPTAFPQRASSPLSEASSLSPTPPDGRAEAARGARLQE